MHRKFEIAYTFKGTLNQTTVSMKDICDPNTKNEIAKELNKCYDLVLKLDIHKHTIAIIFNMTESVIIQRIS